MLDCLLGLGDDQKDIGEVVGCWGWGVESRFK